MDFVILCMHAHLILPHTLANLEERRSTSDSAVQDAFLFYYSDALPLGIHHPSASSFETASMSRLFQTYALGPVCVLFMTAFLFWHLGWRWLVGGYKKCCWIFPYQKSSREPCWEVTSHWRFINGGWIITNMPAVFFVFHNRPGLIEAVSKELALGWCIPSASL